MCYVLMYGLMIVLMLICLLCDDCGMLCVFYIWCFFICLDGVVCMC